MTMNWNGDLDPESRTHDATDRQHMSADAMQVLCSANPNLASGTPAVDLVAEGLDELIERAALTHVAPLFRKIGPQDADYRKTEQFARLKAFTLDVLAAHPAAGSAAKAVRVINLDEVSLKTIYDTYEQAFAPLDPNLMANDIKFHICELIKSAAVAEPIPATDTERIRHLERERDLARSAARHEAENADMWRKRALGL